MGVIYGLVMFGMGFWYHSTIVQRNVGLPESEKENAIKWFGIGAAVFLVGLLLGYLVNWLIVEGVIGGIAVGIGAEFGRTSGGKSGFAGVFFEFLPLILGLLASYLVRHKFIQKKDLGIGKLLKKR